MEYSTDLPSRKDRRKREYGKKKFRLLRWLFRILFFLLLLALFTIAIVVLCLRLGLAPDAQEWLVTTSMTTLHHKYIANIVADSADIKSIMKNNNVEEPTQPQNVALVTTEAAITTTSGAIELIPIKQDGYKGYLLKIPDPSRIFLGVTPGLGTRGSKITELIKQYDAVGGINASGFKDVGGHGKGDAPSGILISEGKIKYIQQNQKTFNIIGFNESNILILGKYTLEELKTLHLRDAMDFRPFLILNGIPAKINGNGGWGSGPRTAIGQTADGTVLFLVIDGRQLSSVGATMKQLQELMLEYHAENAANLDGGASTVLYYKDGIVNNPCSPYGDRFLPSAFLIRR